MPPLDATLPPVPEPPARLVAGRWRVEAPIGRGAFGSVWRGADVATGAPVAVKFLEPGTTLDLARVRKEVAALRLLRVPGVVELFDAGTQDGRHYLVMEHVDGLPFPGPARGWPEIAPLVARLCETLRQIHARGVVHRDLKPSNVLVTAAGRVVVLDFGVARGAALGTTVTGSADVVGTPLYLAPEQVHREAPVDGRADLYALGVMLYESLAGERPFAGRTAQELMVARVTREAPRLSVAGVPEGVAELVGRLLEREPERRPASADEVLAALEGGETVTMPWLGTRAPVETLLEAARAVRSRDVWGPPGSGRSRVLAEVAAALRAEGREVVELVRGERPVESLGVLSEGSPEPPRPLSGADVAAARSGRPAETDAAVGAAPPAHTPLVVAEARLRGALSRGVVVLADDLGRLDRWSRALVERARGDGCVLRVAQSPGAVTLEGLGEGDLWELFHGPDVILHLREDGAKALFARTGGVPARVAAEVRAWVARGEARWEDGKLRVDRAAIEAFAAGPAVAVGARPSEALEEPLDALLAWVVLAGSAATPELLVAATGLPEWEVEVELAALEEQGAVRRVPGGGVRALTSSRALARWSPEERDDAHRRLAAALPDGAPERLGHLVAAGDTDHIEGAAVTLARSVLETGAAGKALAVLQLAVREVTAGADAGASGAVSEATSTELARAALVDGSGPAVREARAALERAGAADLAGLVAAWEAAGERRYEDAEGLVGGIDRFADAEMEAWRVALPVRVAVATDLDEAERRITALVVEPGSVIERRRREWLGHLRYRQGRYEEAAELHMEAARAETGVARRANALINAGLAWRDGFRLEEALGAFGEAGALASEARLPVLEGHAVVGERTTLYRLGAWGAHRPDFVAAIVTLDDARLIGLACLNEAAIAWRNGLADHAETLARRAALAWDHPSTHDAALLATALACAAGGRAPEAQLLAPSCSRLAPLYRFQAMALLSLALPDSSALGDAGHLPQYVVDQRLGVLSPAEASAIRGGNLHEVIKFRDGDRGSHP